MSDQVRIRWDHDCHVSETWPFTGIIVEYLNGQRISDIPLEQTPAIIHAVVGKLITISHFVKTADDQFIEGMCKAKKESLTLLVTANEIPEAKREELKQAWIQFMTESDGH